MKLTKETIEQARPNSIIHIGETIDDPNGLFMTGSGELLKFIIFRGDIADWCVYTHFIDSSIEYIRKSGDKPHQREHISNIVEFDDEVWEMYRH